MKKSTDLQEPVFLQPAVASVKDHTLQPYPGVFIAENGMVIPRQFLSVYLKGQAVTVNHPVSGRGSSTNPNSQK